jgi:hypothetical protein
MMNEPSPERSGGLTGALLGGMSRPVVVAVFWLGAQSRAEMWLTLLLSSCLIGLFLGWVAGRIAGDRGSIRHPWTGPLIGAVAGAALGFSSSVLTLTCLCVLTRDSVREVNIARYWTTMAIVGGLPGLCGGLTAYRVRKNLADQGPDDHRGRADETSGS